LVKRAVILAAGSASRMQKGIEKYIKDPEELAAIRKGEKMAARFSRFPFLDYQILSLAINGLKEINIVLNPKDTFFKTHYTTMGKKLFPEVEISFSYQEIPDGTAHALLCAKDFIGGERFLALNGDNYYPDSSIRMLINSPEKLSAMVGYDRECFNPWVRDRVKSYAVIKTRDGKLDEIVEKSDNPEVFRVNDILIDKNEKPVKIEDKILVSMSIWCFTPEIMRACSEVPMHPPRAPGKRGEYELPDAVKLFLDWGNEILVYYDCGDVLDLTKPEDIEIVSKQIKEKLIDLVVKLENRYVV